MAAADRRSAPYQTARSSSTQRGNFKKSLDAEPVGMVRRRRRRVAVDEGDDQAATLRGASNIADVTGRVEMSDMRVLR